MIRDLLGHGLAWLHFKVVGIPPVAEVWRMQRVDAWFGDGDTDPVGPLEAYLVTLKSDETGTLLITDRDWLDRMAWDEPWFTYTDAPRLPDNRFVSYDGYAWAPMPLDIDE